MRFKHWIILIFLMLLYHYNVYFWFLFTHIRKFFFLWGIYLFLFHRKRIGFKFPLKFPYRFTLYTFLIVLLTLLAALRGGGLEMMALQIPVSFLINTFAAFPIVYYLSKWSISKDNKSIINNAVTTLVFAIVANNGIAISKLIIQPLYEFLMNLQIQPVEMSDSISRFDAYRLGGWGDNLVFSGGTSSALGIVLSMYKYCNSQDRKSKILYLSVILFIIFSGILIARTTLIGIPLACLVMFYYIDNFKVFIKYVLIGVIFCAVLVGLFLLIVPMLDESMAAWAFEMVFSLLEHGEITSASTNDLKNMWEIVPTNPVTWIIGDGIFKTPTGYYKGTDVGVFRIIFFIGLVGLMVIIKLFRLFFFDKKADKETRALENILFFWFLVMNLKGVFMPIHVACIFFLINNINNTKVNYEPA